MSTPPTPFPGAPAAPRRVSRRSLLTGLLGTGAAAAAGVGIHRSFQGDGRWTDVLPGREATSRAGGPFARAATSAGPSAVPAAVAADPDLARRVLVVVELAGGNDGLATLVPLADPAYRQLRPNLALADEEAIWIDDTHGVHPALGGVQAAGVAWLQGVGSRSPSRSHFDMEARWWAGDSDGDARLATGFLGRLCDELDAGAPVTGVSLGGGSTPALVSASAVTLGLPDPGGAWYLTAEDQWFGNLRAGMRRLAGAGQGPFAAATGRGLTDALAFGEVLAAIDQAEPEGYPGSDLGRQLSLAARLIDAEVGIRVVHVPTGGYDTHDDQRGVHDALMAELNDALVAFLLDLEARGRLGSTLVATTSEFGRRPTENGTGTDHGAASVALLCGPVVAGRHGEHPSLTDLDEEDDLVATMTVEDYYGTLAEEWLGVSADLVLPRAAAPLRGVVRT